MSDCRAGRKKSIVEDTHTHTHAHTPRQPVWCTKNWSRVAVRAHTHSLRGTVARRKHRRAVRETEEKVKKGKRRGRKQKERQVEIDGERHGKRKRDAEKTGGLHLLAMTLCVLPLFASALPFLSF